MRKRSQSRAADFVLRYFLRSRGLWYLDDFAERFPGRARFLVYPHPPGQAQLPHAARKEMHGRRLFGTHQGLMQDHVVMAI